MVHFKDIQKDMKKKAYQSPVIDIVVLHPVTLLAGSELGRDMASDEEARSRENNWSDDE